MSPWLSVVGRPAWTRQNGSSGKQSELFVCSEIVLNWYSMRWLPVHGSEMFAKKKGQMLTMVGTGRFPTGCESKFYVARRHNEYAIYIFHTHILDKIYYDGSLAMHEGFKSATDLLTLKPSWLWRRRRWARKERIHWNITRDYNFIIQCLVVCLGEIKADQRVEHMIAPPFKSLVLCLRDKRFRIQLMFQDNNVIFL